MNTASLKASSLLTAAALLSSTCSGFCSGQRSTPTPTPNPTPARHSGFSIGLGGTAGALLGVIVLVIAKHEASERQKKIAAERARQAYARMSAERRASLKKKKVRYIAVDTEKDAKTSPKAQKSVMVWDTESQQVAGSSVYDVKSPPAVGSTAKFDDYSAEYVGSGT